MQHLSSRQWLFQPAGDVRFGNRSAGSAHAIRIGIERNQPELDLRDLSTAAAYRCGLPEREGMRSQQERVRLSRGLDGGHCLCIRYLRLCSDDRACNEVMESAAFLVEQDNDELAPGPNLNANKRPSEPRRRMRI